MHIRYVLPLIYTAALAGCASSGTYVDESQVTRFKKGETTIQQVEQALGAPGTRTIMPDGGITLSYTYVEVNSRPENFIPLIGGLIGGADTRSTMANFTFTSDGILKNSMYSGSQRGTSVNLSSKAPVERVDVKAREADKSPTQPTAQ